MSPLLRINLIVVCFFTLWYVVRKIRKSQMQIGDTVFWVLFALFLLAMSLFPAIGWLGASLLGIGSTVNFVLLSIIFLLLLKLFWMSMQISHMENKLIEIVQHIALSKVEKDDDEKKDNSLGAHETNEINDDRQLPNISD